MVDRILSIKLQYGHSFGWRSQTGNSAWPRFVLFDTCYNSLLVSLTELMLFGEFNLRLPSITIREFVIFRQRMTFYKAEMYLPLITDIPCWWMSNNTEPWSRDSYRLTESFVNCTDFLVRNSSNLSLQNETFLNRGFSTSWRSKG